MPIYTRKPYFEMFGAGNPVAATQPQPSDLIAQARSVLAEQSGDLPVHGEKIYPAVAPFGQAPIILSRGPVAAGDTALFPMTVINDDTVPGVCGLEVSPFLSITGHALTPMVEPGSLPLPPGASRDFNIRVPVPKGNPPGRYHAVATVTAAEADPIVLILHVRGAQ